MISSTSKNTAAVKRALEQVKNLKKERRMKDKEKIPVGAVIDTAARFKYVEAV